MIRAAADLKLPGFCNLFVGKLCPLLIIGFACGSSCLGFSLSLYTPKLSCFCLTSFRAVDILVDCLLRNSVCSPLLSLLVWLEKDVCMNPLSMNLASVLVYM